MFPVKTTLQALLCAALLIVSCSKSSEVAPAPAPSPTPTPTPTPTVRAPQLPLPAGWKMAAGYLSGVPNNVDVYFFDSLYAGRSTRAYAVAFPAKATNLQLKPVLATTAQGVSSFYSQEAGAIAAINAGYFGGGQSYSWVRFNQQNLSVNIRALTRSYNGNNTSYYPTRAAMGWDDAGNLSCGWVYSVDNTTTYAYPNPSPNALNTAPQAVPGANFPAGGSVYAPVHAIGGSPMLLYGGQIRITDNEELISINNTTSRPRTAIGYTNNGYVILLVVEGDNPARSVGMNLQELAQWLQQLGCTHAINLDGGGSSNMIVGGNSTVRPGDSGAERAVQSALVLKLK